MKIAVLYIISYLLGSISFAYIITRLTAGVDIRNHGSGNPGSMNVHDVLGMRAGLVVLALDACKGAAAVELAFLFNGDPWMAGTMAVIGHMYPVWMRFSGGKGLASALGVVLCGGLQSQPLALSVLLVFAIIWILFYAYFKDHDKASLAGLIAAMAYAMVCIPGWGLPALLAALAIKHFQVFLTGKNRSNIDLDSSNR